MPSSFPNLIFPDNFVFPQYADIEEDEYDLDYFYGYELSECPCCGDRAWSEYAICRICGLEPPDDVPY